MIENKVMTVSVSVLDLFRRWDAGELTQWVGPEGEKEEVEVTWEEFVAMLDQPRTPKMEAGHAFHTALENVTESIGCNGLELPTLEADGWLFDFFECQGDLELNWARELPIQKMYGDLMVRGRCDLVIGKSITDYKLTFSSFDAERYMESYQWRLYLDMFDAAEFQYWVFEGYERRGEMNVIDIKRLHPLKLYRYPEMVNDCRKLAARFREVALRHPQICKLRDIEEL